MDIAAIFKRIFETDTSNATLDQYVALLSNRERLSEIVEHGKQQEDINDAETPEITRAEVELNRLNRAERAHNRKMRIEDLEEYEAALQERIAILEQHPNAVEPGRERGKI